MDRPNDIPQWAWEKSTELCAEWIKEDGSIDVTPHYLVSKAILKAREEEKRRCLDILAAEREWSGDMEVAVERIKNDREPQKIPGWNAPSED